MTTHTTVISDFREDREMTARCTDCSWVHSVAYSAPGLRSAANRMAMTAGAKHTQESR